MAEAHTRAKRIRWRVVSAFISLGLFAWGLAALVYVDAKGARAESEARFHDVETVLLVPQDGEWFYVKVSFFMYDNGDGTFDAAADTARAEMAGRFPGAVEVQPGSVSAAYVTSGFKWMSGSASWTYDSSGVPGGLSAQPSMQAAAATWGQQGANFQFTGGNSSSNGTGACGGGTDGSNTVGWGAQSGSVLAVTCSWFGTTGNPFKPAVEFDMEFDPDWNWTTGSPIQVDLESVALHEFGHALGLNHSGAGSAVMFASYSQGSNKRTPTQDDIDGITFIYGQQGGPPATNTPTNTPTTPAGTATPTNTPGGPTATPTSPLPTSTPTRTPTPPQGGGGGNPTPPLATSTPTKTPTPGSGGGSSPTPGSTSTPTPSATFTPAPSATPTKSPTPGSGAPSLPIVPGANLLAWPGSDMAPAVALAGVANLKIVYAYEPVTRHWTRFIPGAPGYLNNLPVLKKGGAYWFIATGSAQVPFQP